MKSVFVFILSTLIFFPSYSQTFETSTIDFDLPNRIDAIRASNIGGSPIEVYANGDKTKFFYQPLLKPQWQDFYSLLQEKCSNSKSAEISIPLKIEFSNKDLETELRTKLRNRGYDVVSLSTLPYAYYQIFARLGEREIVLNQDELPSINSGISLSIQTTLPYPYGYYKVQGTCLELTTFYEERMLQNILRGQLFAQGFSFSSDYVNAFAKLSQNQSVKNQLFGDEEKENKTITTSKSSGGGWGVNLGSFKAGKSKGKTTTVAEVKNKRFVTRDFVREVIRQNSYSLGLVVQGNPERTKDIVNQFTSTLLSSFKEIELEFEKISEESFNLVKGQLLYANIGSIEYKSLLEAKPNLTYSSKDNQTVTLPDGTKASDSKDENFTYSNNIRWEWDGENWIPTKVKMFIVSKDALDKQINLEAMYFNEEGKRVTASQFIFPAAWLYENNKEEQNINNFHNPIGSIIPFAGPKDKIPSGWMLCDGTYLPIEGNENIFNIIGYNWGKRESQFKLPNLQGQFLRGTAYTSNNDPNKNSRIQNGENISNEVGSFQLDTDNSITRIRTEGWTNHGNIFTEKPLQNGWSGRIMTGEGGDNGAKAYIYLKREEKEVVPKNAYVNFIIRVR